VYNETYPLIGGTPTCLGDQVGEMVVGSGNPGGNGVYTRPLEGEIAEFRIYDGALTPAEVVADYNSHCASLFNPVLPECGNDVVEGNEQCDGTDQGICPVGIPCTDSCTCDWPPGSKIVELRADQANGTGPYPSSPGNASPWVDLINGHHAALQAFAVDDADSGWQGTGLPPIGPNAPDPYRLEWDSSSGQTAFITGGSIPQLNPYDPNQGYSMTLWFRTDADPNINNPDDREMLVEWRDLNSCPYAGINVSYGVLPGPLEIWTCCTSPPGSGWVASTGDVDVNEWHHVVVTKRSGAVRMYLDGDPNAIYEALDPDPESLCLGDQVDDLVLGAGNYGDPGFPTPVGREMAGAIAQFCLYDYELDPGEVFADYAADAALYQCVDLDGDGVTNCDGDCDDNDPGNYPGNPELCDNQDNNCDTLVDEGNPEGGGQCGTTDVGECEFGSEECQSGSLVCVGNIEPVDEICDGLDNNCDGAVDDGNPGGGGPCGTTDAGECELGVEECQSGSLVCVGNIEPVAELCDALDNNCDGTTDEDFANLGQACTLGVGECEDSGVYVCTGDQLGTECDATPGTPSTELCDGLDNDCEGTADEDNPEGGGQCGTSDVGECDFGIYECQSPSLVCVGSVEPVDEICANGLDDDCDGDVDDEDLCGRTLQTKTQQICINELNKGFAKVVKAQGKDMGACLKNGSMRKLGVQSIEECLSADNRGKVAKTKQKMLSKAGPKCTQAPGMGPNDPNTMNRVAVEKELALIHDIFGSDLDAVIADALVEQDEAKCQVAVAKAAQKCHDTKLKEFNKCKKAGLKDGSIARASELQLCMGLDLKGKIKKACDTKLGSTISKKCPASVDLTAAFPSCNTSDPGTLKTNIDAFVECAMCKALNEADRLARDCDLFDDALDNDSCP
jgi:hypothetical protein